MKSRWPCRFWKSGNHGSTPGKMPPPLKSDYIESVYIGKKRDHSIIYDESAVFSADEKVEAVIRLKKRERHRLSIIWKAPDDRKVRERRFSTQKDWDMTWDTLPSKKCTAAGIWELRVAADGGGEVFSAFSCGAPSAGFCQITACPPDLPELTDPPDLRVRWASQTIRPACPPDLPVRRASPGLFVLPGVVNEPVSGSELPEHLNSLVSHQVSDDSDSPTCKLILPS